MKQNITKDQLNELSEKGKEKIRGWQMEPYKGTWYEGELSPLLSIGQMIEFLGDFCIDVDLSNGKLNGTGYITEAREDGMELCDALWEACKEVLEDEKPPHSHSINE